MMNTVPALDETDSKADEEILTCLTPGKFRSFFLFAGAGSGKTRSLVTALRAVRDGSGRNLRLRGQRIGVITYTNAACDEIRHRSDFDPLIEVATIHSFVWSLISTYQSDIRNWLDGNLRAELAELNEAQRKGRPGSKAAADRARKIESKTRRLALLPTIRKFQYSPTGDNRGRDSINHAEVIKICADFLESKPLMQSVLVNRFPILLIDESQDTNALLMDALLVVQSRHRDRFALGLFGDTMQRIYADGKEGLGENLPKDWATPAKVMNHRSPRRVVQLINKVRSAVDDQEQRPRSDSQEGFVRLFIISSGTATDKAAVELAVKKRMAEITSDQQWASSNQEVKTLILEHLMAARRMGFLELFEPLYLVRDGALRTSLLEGSLPGLRFFSHAVLPLVKAQQKDDQFAVGRIMRSLSPLVSRETLKNAGIEQSAQMRRARAAISELMKLWANNAEPLLRDILGSIGRTGLFEIPESLQPIALREASGGSQSSQPVDPDDDVDEIIESWEKSLLAPFSQIEAYASYVAGTAPFGTHQGVKGLEFPRVLVIMDDAESRGFMFKYEKLFGAEPQTQGDLDRKRQGEDTGIDRVRRLFYVTCSRAQNSLTLVAYSTKPHIVRDHVIREGWLQENEIEML